MLLKENENLREEKRDTINHILDQKRAKILLHLKNKDSITNDAMFIPSFKIKCQLIIHLMKLVTSWKELLISIPLNSLKKLIKQRKTLKEPRMIDK